MFRDRLDWIELIVAVAIVGSAWIYFTRVPVDAASAARIAPRENFRAPEFSLPALDGRQVSLSDLRGQAVLVNFWATWCPPCRAEMPEIQAAYQNHRGQNLTVLAINQAEDDQPVSQFAQQLHLTFPILLDRDGTIARQYQVQGLPASFFVDRDGVIRAASLGQMNRAYIEAELAKLLEQGVK